MGYKILTCENFKSLKNHFHDHDHMTFWAPVFQL